MTWIVIGLLAAFVVGFFVYFFVIRFGAARAARQRRRAGR